jgi:hypothetical protein
MSLCYSPVVTEFGNGEHADNCPLCSESIFPRYFRDTSVYFSNLVRQASVLARTSNEDCCNKHLTRWTFTSAVWWKWSYLAGSCPPGHTEVQTPVTLLLPGALKPSARSSVLIQKTGKKSVSITWRFVGARSEGNIHHFCPYLNSQSHLATVNQKRSWTIQPGFWPEQMNRGWWEITCLWYHWCYFFHLNW